MGALKLLLIGCGTSDGCEGRVEEVELSIFVFWYAAFVSRFIDDRLFRW